MLVRGIYRGPSLDLRVRHRKHEWNMCPVAVRYVRLGSHAPMTYQISRKLVSQVQCTQSRELGLAGCEEVDSLVQTQPSGPRRHTRPKPRVSAQVNLYRSLEGAEIGPQQSTRGRTSGHLRVGTVLNVAVRLQNSRVNKLIMSNITQTHRCFVLAVRVSDQKWHRYPRARVRPDGTRRRTRNELAARSARRKAPGNKREGAGAAAPTRAQEMNQQPWQHAAHTEHRQPNWQNARGADARPQDQDWYYDDEEDDYEDYQPDTNDKQEVHATEDEDGYLKIWWQGEWWFRQKPPGPPASPQKRHQASSSSTQRRPAAQGAEFPAPATLESESLKNFVPPAKDSVPPQSLRAVREKWNLLTIIDNDIKVLRKKKVALMFKTFFEIWGTSSNTTMTFTARSP